MGGPALEVTCTGSAVPLYVGSLWEAFYKIGRLDHESWRKGRFSPFQLARRKKTAFFELDWAAKISVLLLPFRIAEIVRCIKL